MNQSKSVNWFRKCILIFTVESSTVYSAVRLTGNGETPVSAVSAVSDFTQSALS